MRKHRTTMRNCASENLEIPRCAIAHLWSGASAPSRNDSEKSRVARHSSRCDDLLALLAEAVDAERHDVADIEEGRRLHAGADAGRGAGGDDVAGLERQELR